MTGESNKPKRKKSPQPPLTPLMIDGKSWNKEKVIEIVCNGIATSSRSIGTILSDGFEGNKLPSFSVVMGWLSQDTDFQDKYAKAKESQSDFMAEEMLDIADDARNDWMERFDKEGQSVGWALNGDHVQRSKLRIEARKWLMGKLRPKKYGDKITQHISGEGGGPLVVEIVRFGDKEIER